MLESVAQDKIVTTMRHQCCLREKTVGSGPESFGQTSQLHRQIYPREEKKQREFIKETNYLDRDGGGWVVLGHAWLRVDQRQQLNVTLQKHQNKAPPKAVSLKM